MSVSAALRDALLAAPGVAALVGARVYRDERPEGDPLPAIVILLVSDPRPMTYSGAQSLRRARLQLDCLGDSRGLADEIGEAAIAAVEGKVLVAPFDSVRIANVRNDSSRGNPATTFRTAVDVMAWHHSS